MYGLYAWTPLLLFLTEGCDEVSSFPLRSPDFIRRTAAIAKGGTQAKKMTLIELGWSTEIVVNVQAT